MNRTAIKYLTLSQEDLIDAGAFDFRLAIDALKKSLFLFREGRILFPDKIVQIFKEETQERINCLPATLLGCLLFLFRLMRLQVVVVAKMQLGK